MKFSITVVDARNVIIDAARGEIHAVKTSDGVWRYRPHGNQATAEVVAAINDALSRDPIAKAP